MNENNKKTTGLCSVTFRGKTPRQVISLAKESGLDCIEWGGDIHVPAGELENARNVGELTRAAGLKTISFGSYYKCREGEDFKPIAETAAALGASVVRVWSGEKASADLVSSEYAALVKRIKLAAAEARKKELVIGFEYHGGTCTDSPESALKLLNDVGEDNVRCYFQPAYWLSGSDADRHASDMRALELLRGSIVGVHVYKWRGYDRFALADGAEEWRELIAASDPLFYDLEFVKDDSERQFKEDAAFFSALCGK